MTALRNLAGRAAVAAAAALATPAVAAASIYDPYLDFWSGFVARAGETNRVSIRQAPSPAGQAGRTYITLRDAAGISEAASVRIKTCNRLSPTDRTTLVCPIYSNRENIEPCLAVHLGDRNDSLFVSPGTNLGPSPTATCSAPVYAGPGNDRVYVADRERETVNCGPGFDVAIVDRLDRVIGCERVTPR